MTPDLAELRRLADEATDAYEAFQSADTSDVPEMVDLAKSNVDAGLAFAAAARSAVPALCDEVDRLRGLLDRCEAALAELVALKFDVKATDRDAYEARKPAAWSAARAVLAELRTER